MKHQVVDQRSLELKRVIAGKIRANPSLLKMGLNHIDEYLISPRSSEAGRDSLLEWKQIIEKKPLEEVLSILTEDTPDGQRLRQSSPFTGILTEEERMAIFRKYEPYRA